MKEGFIRHLPRNPKLRGLALMVPDVVFSTATGSELKLQLLRPWEGGEEKSERRFPLIVFLQGSGWTTPNPYFELPQLAEYARSGYVVATITHRSFREGHPAPAFLQDAKTAIRFLRAHAAEYSIDPGRVCFFGTSSGGNTALLVAMTGDEARYKTGEYAEFSDAVQLCIECFGPTDLAGMMKGIPEGDDSLERFFGGGSQAEKMALLEDMSPLQVFKKNKKCVPTLVIHGDADPVVPYEQGTLLYQALIEGGIDAEMICIDGAPHESSFWSGRLHEEILDFIGRRI